jgi:hypothetical protein
MWTEMMNGLHRLHRRAIGTRGQLCGALLAIATFSAVSVGVSAQGFAALVTPPRFELTAKAGERLRQIIEITNGSNQPAKFYLKTADWALDKSAGVTFTDILQSGSCRPWVAIESKEISVSAGGKYRYRFEIALPADAKPGECRFALMLEGDEQTVRNPNGPPVPVAGRVGVIVYLTIGGAEPILEVVGAEVATINGDATPVLQIKNTGSAHGRLTGFLSGTDANGKKLEFTPSNLPILAAETRAISLMVNREGNETLKIGFPITIRGKLEAGDKSMAFEQRFAP